MKIEPSHGVLYSSVSSTYRRLRALASAALILLPLLTALSAYLADGHLLEASLSDYYFVFDDGGLPRTIFVIFLAFLGGVLLAYRGLDKRDNQIHNLAGLFSFGVAIFPMHCDLAEHAHCVPGLLPLLHLPSAGLLYLSAVASVLYGGGPRLRSALGKLPNPQIWLSRLNGIRFSAAALMTIGIAGFFVHALFPNILPKFSWIFWIEYSGFFGFGIYWFCLLRLVDDANAKGRNLRENEVSLSTNTELLNPSTEGWVEIP